MSTERIASQELLAARRALDTVKGVVLLNDWIWHEAAGKWILHCRLSPEMHVDGPIPTSTDWYVLVDASYPWGAIKFYPAKQHGLAHTFPHQNYNGPGSEGVPWREGDLCLNTSVRILGRHGYDIEPYEVHKRLKWHFQRALAWLRAASRGELLRPGEPFELPQFPGAALRSEAVAFCEGVDSFLQWQNIAERYGLLDLFHMREKPDVLVIKAFRTVNGRELFSPAWGRALQSRGDHLLQGIWLRIDSTPVLEPWQAQLTWVELRQACCTQSVDIDQALKATLRSIRDGQEHIAVIGFPIPAQVGSPPRQMHWQAMKLPVLSRGTTTARGFRTNEMGYWQRDRTQLLHNHAPMTWVTSENWHAEQLSTRGKLSERLASRKVLVIGAGALGAPLAELLVRAGVQKLTIIDDERLEMGNLTRHPLGLDDLKTQKASALATQLNLASPHAAVKGINVDFPPVKETDRAQVQRCDVILDCTGHDEVLHYLEDFPWCEAKHFFSISLGFRARRLFCFTAYGTRFPHADFREALESWLKRELEEYAELELPREGVGCWHPVFPARVDDIWMLASVAVKYIESIMSGAPTQPELTVFEQQYEGDVFTGIRRIAPEIGDG